MIGHFITDRQMKIRLTIFLFAINLCCFSQNILNEYYKLTFLDDVDHKDYYFNGQLRCSFTIKNRNLEGEHIFYFKNGKVSEILYFENGYFHGTNKSYNEKGQLLKEEKYTHDTLLYYKEIRCYNNGNIKTERYLHFDTDSLKINPFIKTNYHTVPLFIEYDVNLSVKSMKSYGKNVKYFKNGRIKKESYLVTTERLNFIF